jgi:replicative DNA helicase
LASVVEVLEALTGEATLTRAQPVAKDIAEGESIFTAANTVDTRRILDRYGIEHEERHARCPGCGEPGALICEGGGLKCLHNRCSHVGPPNHPGLRLNVDLVAEREQVLPRRAAELICDWFGVARPRRLPARDAPPLALGEHVSRTAFPTSALPALLKAWVEAEAIATQTPADLPAVVALATVSACVAKKVEVEVRSGWREPLNTYWLVALEPGNRKSAVFRDAVEPLLRHERILSEQMRAPIQAALTRLEVKQRAQKRAVETAVKTGTPEDLQLAAELKIDLEAEKVPVMPRLVVDDVTPERLAAMLAEQGGRLALLSAEGGLFELAGGRYSDGVPNLDVFLKGHPGDDLRVDRIGRAPVHVRKPALTLGLVVQPDVIRDLARKPGFRGSGLLARFFFSLPQSLVGSRDIAPPAVPPDVTTTYSDLCSTLLTLPEQREDGELVPLVVRFDDPARRALEDFSRELESRLGAGGDLAAISDWANKLAGGVARIAGLLHFAALGAQPRGDESSPGNSEYLGNYGNGNQTGGLAAPFGTVGYGTARSSVIIGRYLLDHAQSAFALIGADPEITHAKRILAWIERSGSTRFSKRDVWLSTRGYFKKASELDAPLSLLCEHGYLREERPERSGPGRKPGAVFTVLGRSHNSQNPQNSASAPSGPGGR